MAISELQDIQGIAVNMIDTLSNNAALNHRLMPFRLFKKPVQQGRSE
jgi:hypothetical protein